MNTQNWRPYYVQKKQETLDLITPLLASVNITNFEFIQEFRTDDEQETPRETLRIRDTYIGCTSNTPQGNFLEAVNYVWVCKYVRVRNIGRFQAQTLECVTKYWRKEL
jgi:hypothetical protein